MQTLLIKRVWPVLNKVTTTPPFDGSFEYRTI